MSTRREIVVRETTTSEGIYLEALDQVRARILIGIWAQKPELEDLFWRACRIFLDQVVEA